MARLVRYHGLDKGEYETLKAELKKALPGVSIRYNKQGYAYGTINIGPSARQSYTWTEEQFATARAFLAERGLSVMQQSILDGPNAYYCFRHGIAYIHRCEVIINA